MPPDARSGPEGPPRSQTPPPSRSTASLPDQGDPRRVGELLGDWLAIRMIEVDGLVDEARARVESLPDQRVLWSGSCQPR
jgi:hypothetical protein